MCDHVLAAAGVRLKRRVAQGGRSAIVDLLPIFSADYFSSLCCLLSLCRIFFWKPLGSCRKDPWRSPRLGKDKESASPAGAAANSRPRCPSTQGSASEKGHHHHAENGGERMPCGTVIGGRRNRKRQQGLALSFLQRAPCPFFLLWSWQDHRIRTALKPDSRLRMMDNGSLRTPLLSMRQQDKGSLLPVGMSLRRRGPTS